MMTTGSGAPLSGIERVHQLCGIEDQHGGGNAQAEIAAVDL